MKYHKQEHLVVPGQPTRGSCYPTVLACFLDLDLHDVPYFHLFYYTEEEKANLYKIYDRRYLKNKPIADCEQYEQDNYRHAISTALNFWNTCMEVFLSSRGYYIDVIKNIDEWLIDNPDVPYMALGDSSRGVGHIVIYKNGQLYHDPHPSNEGLANLDPADHYPFRILKKIE